MSEPDEKRALIAERIREARKSAGLSQGQIAKLMGLHRPSVSEIEAGNRRVSADELTTLAGLLDVTVSWLVGDAPETVETNDPRIQLAARELNKLKPEDLDRLLRLLASMRDTDDTPRRGGKK
ncbi:MAG: helix-turn-helix transcriptional regulator [Hyphomicrobium sp.]|nr:helix-turn-helix transcriptional regulator [Hyphomicrobium sp.]